MGPTLDNIYKPHANVLNRVDQRVVKGSIYYYVLNNIMTEFIASFNLGKDTYSVNKW